tara:strand:- start:43 stop:585 length:543 start_codon:yes stop_codon:yes gene_type:complete
MHQIYDNFLDTRGFKVVRDCLLHQDFPWYYNPTITGTDYDHDVDLFQFVHPFYMESPHHMKSKHTNFIAPVLQKLAPKRIIRVKANLRTKASGIHKSDFHVDTLEKGKTAIFYINSNNGYTEFKDGTKVNSVANRLVLFDTDMMHLGTSCTDEKIRVVLNINYEPVMINGEPQLPPQILT